MVYRFDSYELDTNSLTLTQSGRPVEIQPLPLRFLIFLAENHHRNLAIDEIKGKVWEGTCVEKNTVHAAARKVRIAAGDKAAVPTGGGYKFTWDIRTDEVEEVEEVRRVFNHSGNYLVRPATPSDIHWVADLATRVYRGVEIIPLGLMLEWYDANPGGFTVVERRDGTLVGNLDLLPIRPRTLEHFAKGDITEQDIFADALYSPGEREKVRDLYIESFVSTMDPAAEHPRVNTGALQRVLKDFWSISKLVCDPGQLQRLYALAATRPGETLLTTLGFRVEAKAKQRKDGHDLYVADFKEFAKILQSSFGGTTD